MKTYGTWWEHEDGWSWWTRSKRYTAFATSRNQTWTKTKRTKNQQICIQFFWSILWFWFWFKRHDSFATQSSYHCIHTIAVLLSKWYWHSPSIISEDSDSSGESLFGTFKKHHDTSTWAVSKDPFTNSLRLILFLQWLPRCLCTRSFRFRSASFDLVSSQGCVTFVPGAFESFREAFPCARGFCFPGCNLF